MEMPQVASLAPMESADAGRGTPRALWLLVLFFLLINIPPAANFTRYFGDERFYSDGAIEMIQKREYFTPMDGDGGYFYNKPALTFWLMLASYKIMGVSLLSTRLPFLLAACGTLFLTYKLTLSLFRESSIALLAAAMLAGNVLFIHESCFSITDALLTLAMLVSHYGFMQIVINGRKSERNYACAYLGVCLGFGVKGILGFLPAVIAWAFTAWQWYWAPKDSSEKSTGLRDLIHVPLMLLTVFVVAGWFVSMWLVHGEDFTKVFLADQGLARLHDSQWSTNWRYYPSVFAIYFFPWYIPLLVLALFDRAALKQAFNSHRKTFLYLIAWMVLMFIFYLPGNLARSRYILPTFPLFSVLIAALPMLGATKENLSAIWKRTAIGCGFLVLIAGIFFSMIGHPLDQTVITGGVLMSAISIVFLIVLFRTKWAAPYVLTVFTCIVVAVVDTYILDCFNDLPTKSVAAILQNRAESRASVTVVGRFGNDFAPQLREAMGSLVKVSNAKAAIVNLQQLPVLVFTQLEQHELKLEQYTVFPAGSAYRNKVLGDRDHVFSFGDYMKAWWRNRPEEYLATCRLEFYVAVHKAPL